MKLRHSLLPAILACVSTMALAQSTFDGTWLVNQEKSKLAGDTLRFSAAGPGMLKYTDSTESYSFKPDGTPVTTPTGTERTFTKVDALNYEGTSKHDGTTTSTSTWKLSDDGKTLTVDFKGTRPNGDAFDNSEVYRRTTPGKGLIGAWTSTEVKMTAPAALTIASQGKTGVNLSLSAEKAECAAKWDGKDYAVTGPTVPAGLTIAVSITGPHSFKLVQKLKGKPIVMSHFTISADGKVLTERGTDGQGKEPYTEVSDKQS